MSFRFINKTLGVNNLKTRKGINAKISVFLVCVEAVIYLLLHNLHSRTFNSVQLQISERKLPKITFDGKMMITINRVINTITVTAINIMKI